MAGNPDLFQQDDPDTGDENGAPSGFFDAVADAGERKGVGRPRGARNRKSVDFEKLYYQSGRTDPLLWEGDMLTMDPRSLQAKLKELGEDVSLMEILDFQRRCATDLAPYLHGKKPTELVLTDERLPTLFIMANTNQMEQAQRIQGERQALSLGTPIEEGEASKIKDLEGDE
jgi:hypothetical protein